MPEKIRIAAKPHICAACGGIIEKGEKYSDQSGRIPKVKDGEEQIGVEYWRARFHFHDCTAPEDCQRGRHEFIDEMVPDGYVSGNRVYVPTGKNVCKNCGVYEI